MVNSNRSELDLKSFMVKKLKTAKHSKFSNQFEVGNSIALSSARSRSDSLAISTFKKSFGSKSPSHHSHRISNSSNQNSAYSAPGAENIPTEVCDEDVQVEKSLQRYSKR